MSNKDDVDPVVAELIQRVYAATDGSDEELEALHLLHQRLRAIKCGNNQ